ncbi:hypothetical protein DL98DRAFT_619623 [Cadophora sp. DSE1049]|nr:hypothetical protein DL98DRAFT_619623 [Cadophora sp. DSE1049]
MAGFVDVRGSGLARAQRALAGLEEYPERLDRERRRFSDSPPPYKSDIRRMQLGRERDASRPRQQFSAQVEEERRRIWNTDPSTSGRELTIASLDTFKEVARENVKKRWHEDSLELESESETDTEAEASRPRFSFKPQRKPRRPKSDDERRRIAERRVVREREREASPPYHQFVYQISKERKRIQEESTNGEGADAADINTRAYENVKNRWTKPGIWNKRWDGPNLADADEEPLEETADGPAPVRANSLVNGSHGAREAPTRLIFGSPSPVESNHRQASGVMNKSQQGPSAAIDSASRSSKRRPSQKEGQPSSASLGPVHSSKVSKPAVKKKPGSQRRLNISQKVSSDGLPLSSGVDAAEPQPSPDRVTPCRSKRIQPPVPSVAKGPAKTASTAPSKRAVRSKPEQKVASSLTARSSAKPQGISKKQPANYTGEGKEKMNN